MDYAIIETGGKQYRVSPGDILEVELLDTPDNKQGVIFDKVLLVANGDTIEIGTPYLKNAKVLAKVLENVKGNKVITFKYKNKINYHRTIGHRQNFTKVQIEEIHV